MAFNIRSWLPWASGAPSPPAPTTAPTSTSTSTPGAPPGPPSLSESTRLRRQLSLLIGGGAFLVLSVAITRRSIHRRRLSLVPAYYHPNVRPIVPPSGAMDAVEALNLATLNTMSFAMMLVGGGMFALDVASVDELRERVRERTGGGEQANREAEEEFEEWVVSVLARKERRDAVKRMVERGKEEGGRK